MAKLEGVKVLDAMNGEVTRIEYDGEVYEKVDDKAKDGDIVQVVDGFGELISGDFAKVNDLNGFVYVYDGTGERAIYNGRPDKVIVFRKVTMQPSLADRVAALEEKSNDLEKRVSEIEKGIEIPEVTINGVKYRKVNSRKPRVGDYIKFDEAPCSYLTAGKYYEITSLTYGDPVIIDDDGDTYFVGDGDEFKVYEKVTEDKPDKPEVKVGDFVRLISKGKPCYGWGGASKGAVGKVTEINGEELFIDFPNHKDWHGLVSEVEKVTDENELKFLRIGRKPGEFKVGDIVRTVSYDGGHPKGTIGEISELRGDTKYVKAIYKSNGSTDQNACAIKFSHKDVELVAPVEARVDRP